MRWLGVVLLAGIASAGEADATRTWAACVATSVHEISLRGTVVVDNVVVRTIGDAGTPGPRVTVESAGFQRVLVAPTPGEHALRFFPGLRGGTFRVVVGAAPSRSTCVQEVTLSSGPQIVASVRP